MRTIARTIALAVLVTTALACVQAETAEHRPDQWSVGYWTPWGEPPIPLDKIEWGALTHVVHAWALVREDGTLDLRTQRIASDAPALVAQARKHGVEPLLGVSQAAWRGDKSSLRVAANRDASKLASLIVKTADTYGFAGVDIDWEPFDSASDGDALERLATALRKQLGARTLTAAAIVTDYQYWGMVHAQFDRISAMTYDLTGTWNGNSSHNAPLYGPDESTWSVDLAVKRFTRAGVPISKLSIGIPFFGYEWKGGGVTGPGVRWNSNPVVRQTYYQQLAATVGKNPQRWDPVGKVPYISIDKAGVADDAFITFDDERSIREKIDYARSKKLGGWIIWELFGDYLPNANPRQPLLNAIKEAMTGP